ncbi:helix-turn-helix domain-containing protein [Alkalihalobacillus oceani]|uniref:helix-turn-helix domain-containing protein n=1 Tax=Halalkalibacter oceani TaxID=1653776 RepID=UPI00203FD704|nr:helix-turn-helix domain-containing protein [Halalkalibacter oceani]MCM3761837.1 helix-turn-helix domain-containing protein [Halalkalibacter oceani]
MNQRMKSDYPLILKAEHISEIIGCSKRVAYEVMDRADFPLVRMGRLKRVEREAFFEWIGSQTRQPQPSMETRGDQRWTKNVIGI